MAPNEPPMALKRALPFNCFVPKSIASEGVISCADIKFIANNKPAVIIIFFIDVVFYRLPPPPTDLPPPPPVLILGVDPVLILGAELFELKRVLLLLLLLNESFLLMF